MKIDLLQNVEYGGCSAKISPKQLEEILKYLPLPKDTNILVDIDTQDYVEEHPIPDLDLDYNLKMIAFDAQTSGGLMMSVSSNIVESVLLDLNSAGLTSAAIIGEVTELREKYISLGN